MIGFERQDVARSRGRSRIAGFTLIELMIVVAIMGLLAAIAIPSMMVYVRRSKAAEAYDQVKQIFNQAATYYSREHSMPGMGASVGVSCTVGTGDNGVTPDDGKQPGNYGSSPFAAFGMTSTTIYSYYRYEIENRDSASGRCSTPPSTQPLYVIRALGDLDQDDISSLFELATGSNADNELFHARSFYVNNETE